MLKKLLRIAGVVLLLYSFAGFIVLPLALHFGLTHLAPTIFTQPLQIGGFTFNPFTLRMRLEAFILGEDTEQPLVGFHDLNVKLGWQSLPQKALVIDEVTLSNPVIDVAITENGTVNLASIVAQSDTEEPKPEKESSSPLSIWLKEFSLIDGHIDFDTQLMTAPGTTYAANLQNIQLFAENIRWPLVAGQQGMVSLETNLNGVTPIAVQTTISQGETPDIPDISAQLSIADLMLPPLQPFITPWAYTRVESGAFSTMINAEWQQSQGVRVSGNSRLDKVKIYDSRSNDYIVGFQQFAVNGLQFDQHNNQLILGAIELAQPYTTIDIDKEMHINLADLMVPQPAKEEETNEPEAEPEVNTDATPFSMAMQQFNVRSGQVLVNTDWMTAPNTAYQANLQAIDVSVENVAWPLQEQPSKQPSFTLSTQLNKVTPIHISGSLAEVKNGEPTAADLALTIDNLQLASFQPYVTPWAYTTIRDGALSASTAVNWHAQQGVTVSGDSRLTSLSVTDSRSNVQLLGLKELSVEQMQFNQQENELTIGTIALDSSYANVAIDENRKVNLAELMKEQPAKATVATNTTESKSDKDATPFRLEISKFSLDNGQLQFADRTFKPGFSAAIKGLQGQLLSFDTYSSKPANIKLDGELDNYTPVNITASLIPSHPFTDTHVDMSFTDIELTTLTPYSTHFAGYPVRKGQMNLALNYDIKNEQLIAQNSILLKHLQLGKQEPGKHALGNIPINFAIALLTDSQGNINLDIPVTGDLNNPQFQLGPVIGEAVERILMNVVSAPFKLLGSLVPNLSSDTDLSTIAFAAGADNVVPKQQKTLADLAIILAKRPQLHLDVQSYYNELIDKPVLAENALNQKLLESYQERTGDTTLPIDTASPQQMAAAVKEIPDGKMVSLLDSLLISMNLGEQESAVATNSDKRQLLIANWPVSSVELRELAIARSKAIKDDLISDGVNTNRVFILDVAAAPKGQQNTTASKLSLSAG